MSNEEIKAGIMLAIATPACATVLVGFTRRGWLDALVGQIAATAVIYAILLIALAPPLLAGAGEHQGIAVGWLAMYAGVIFALVRLPQRLPLRPAQQSASATQAAGAQGATIHAYQADYQFEEEDTSNEDWIIEPVDGGSIGDDVGGGLYEPLRAGHADRSEPGDTSALRGTGAAGEGGRPDGAGGSPEPDGSGRGAGADSQGNGMVRGVAVGITDRHPGRRGRGRRLASSVVSGPGAPGARAGAGANGGYDVTAATAVASLAATGASAVGSGGT